MRPPDASYRDRLIGPPTDPFHQTGLGSSSSQSRSTTTHPNSGLGVWSSTTTITQNGVTTTTRESGRTRINEMHAAALGGIAGGALAMLNGGSISRGAFTGASAGLIGSSLLNELDVLTSNMDLMRGNLQDTEPTQSYEELLERFGNGAPNRRAPSETIQNLPSRRIKADETLPSEMQSCCICLAEIEAGDEVKTLPCFHLFHSTCIERWLNQSSLCPICKLTV